MRNIIGLVIGAGFYLFKLLHTGFGVSGSARVVAMHMFYGAVGYFIFRGRHWLRGFLVAGVVIGYGVVMEFMHTETNHPMVQVFVAVGFSVVAGYSTWLGRLGLSGWKRLRA